MDVTVKAEPESDIDAYLSCNKTVLSEEGKEIFLVLPSIDIKTESEEDPWTKKEIKTEVTVEEHSLNLEDLAEPDLEVLESPEDSSIIRSSASNAENSRMEDVQATTGAKRPKECIESTEKKELESCEDVNKPGSCEIMMLHSFDFSEEEKVVFNKLFDKYIEVLEDKRTDAVTLEKKKEVWDVLSNDFCALFKTSKESTEPIIKEEEPEPCGDGNKSGSCGNVTLCSSDLSEDEKIVFNKLIFKYIAVIEDQNTDINTVTNQKKAWEALANDFNSFFKNTKRTPSQLQRHWEYRKYILKNKIQCVRERTSVRNEPLQPSLEDSGVVESLISVSNSETREGLESDQVPADLILPPEEMPQTSSAKQPNAKVNSDQIPFDIVLPELQESSTSEYPSVKVDSYQVLLDLVLPVKEELPEPSTFEQSSSKLDSDRVLVDLILPVKEVSETSDANQPKTELDSGQVSVPLKELAETSTNEKFNLNLHNTRKEPVLTPQNTLSRKRKFANETTSSLTKKRTFQNKCPRLNQTFIKNIELARKNLEAELKELELKRQLQQLQFAHKKEMYKLQLESLMMNTKLLTKRYELRLQELKCEERKNRALLTIKNSEQ